MGYNFRRASELSLNDTRTFAGFTAGFGINFKKCVGDSMSTSEKF